MTSKMRSAENTSVERISMAHKGPLACPLQKEKYFNYGPTSYWEISVFYSQILFSGIQCLRRPDFKRGEKKDHIFTISVCINFINNFSMFFKWGEQKDIIHISLCKWKKCFGARRLGQCRPNLSYFHVSVCYMILFHCLLH